MADKAPFAIAGLWGEYVSPKTGEVTDAYLIITAPANALMLPIHDRMPVIIDPPDFDAWLSAEPPPKHLLRSYPAEKMRAYPISTKVDKAGVEDPSIIDPISPGAGVPVRPDHDSGDLFG
jgi:putative SOS response-associated peptidase YedK